MKNDLTCGVVRDLLPSYVEGLTSEETNAAVEAHLAACPDCAAQKRAMTAPEETAEPEEQAETAKEVDYLKKVKRRRWKWAVGAVLCTLALVAAGFAAKLFLIGEPASAAGMAWQLTEDHDGPYLRLRVDAVESAIAYRNWEVRENDGVATITARRFPVSPLGADGSYETELSLEGLREVWLAERLVWQDGMAISGRTWACLKARTPYVGDAPAVGQALTTLGVGELGTYTMSLQTSRMPYGCTLEFDTAYSEASLRDLWMEQYAWMLLALVDNLETVTWTHPDEDGAAQAHTVTLEESAAMLAEGTAAYNQENGTDWAPLDSVKDYAASPADFQRLTEILNTAAKYRFDQQAADPIHPGAAAMTMD